MVPNYLSLEEAFRIHSDAIAQYGGTDGVRDPNMLDSALAAPQNLCAYGQADADTDVGMALLAAAYWFHISMNHPFTDGNKRTSFMCCIAFLSRNGWDTDIDYDRGLDLSIRLATHSITREELAVAISASLIPNES